MPAVKFFVRFDLDQIILFVDGHLRSLLHQIRYGCGSRKAMIRSAGTPSIQGDGMVTWNYAKTPVAPMTTGESLA